MSFNSILDRLAGQPVAQRRKKRRRPARFIVEALELRLPLTVTVSTAITVAASQDQANYGQAVTLTANVTPSPGGGTVSFLDNGAPLGTASVTSGTATLSNLMLAIGSHHITASFGGFSTAFERFIGSSTVPVVTTVAGDGTGGFAGDNGSATSAALNDPLATAVDGAGDLFIADGQNNRIREVNHATGVITTVAGSGNNGIEGFGGDNGPATSAQLAFPVGIAVDAAGDLFIADSDNNRIRKVDHATGVITTVAGDGTGGFTGDNGPATLADLNDPRGVAVDAAGDLFIADSLNNRVREVDHATAVITTVAGDGTAGFAGDNGAATSAELRFPNGIELDSAGDLFIGDSFNSRVREVDHATGVITTIAGDGTEGFAGDNGPATSAELNSPVAIAIDAAGDLFIAESNNNRIREVHHASGVITTVAGGGTAGLGDNGAATSAELEPYGIAVDSAGDLFIADIFNRRVREVDHATGVITTVAGNGTAGFAGDNGPATAAELQTPEGIAVDSAGDLFIADNFDSRIREVDHATGVITTVAGNGTRGFAGDNGPATAAELQFPTGIAVDAAGDLFIADMYNHRIREVDHATGVITTVAGDGTAGFAGDNGAATLAELSFPAGIAVDAAGDLFIADNGNNRIREVDHATGVITTVAGNGARGFAGDVGPASSAELSLPFGIAVDATGELFVSDNGNNRIREVANGVNVIVAPAPLTITADSKTKIYGAALPTLTASYSGFVHGDTVANLATPPTLSTTATAGSHVSGSPYAITASGAVDANYTISYVAGALTVTPVNLTITADDKSKVYGAALPPLTASYSGFVNGDSAASLTPPPALSTTATAGSHVSGSPYAITASGAVDADYTISYVAGALAVTPAPLTITADDLSKLYGAALPTLTAGYSGFVNGDSVASLTKPPILATAATARSHVSGSPYAITASGAVDADYTISYVPGALTVTPAPLTITADDLSKVYGAALPTLTASYSSFANGDTAASLTTPPTLSTTGTASSHVSGSPYPLTASGAVDADYAITYAPGSLTITPATLTVAADDKTKTLDTENPTLSYSITGFVNGDSASVVSGEASTSTTATAASDIGTYTIVVAAGTLSAADYTFAFQNGTLTITANLQGPFGLVEDIYVIGSGTVQVSADKGVLRNDSGPGQLTVTAAVTTGAEGGTFVFNLDGSFTYTPPANFPGFDYAKYTASDSVGDKAAATVNVLSQTGGVVWKFYESVLHRDPDYAGLQFWINDFAGGGKTGDIAVGFFESTELLNQIIGGYYQQYLGRAADPNGLSFYEDLWRKTGGPEQINAGFALSPEFHALALAQFGAYPDGWLEALYHRILNRTPAQSDLTFWEQQLAGGASEYQVALDFFTSPEAFDNDVTGWYYEYLLRAPTLAEQAQYANQMTAGASDRTIEQQITNLPEYAANPPASPPGTAVRLPDYFPAMNTARTQSSFAATDAVFGGLS